jgi:hypothetical protein
MTPADEWGTSPDPVRLVELLGDRLTLRRARLFAVGYCRHRASIFPRAALGVLGLLEDVADGREPESRLPDLQARLAGQTWDGAELIRQAVIQDWQPPPPAWYMTRLQALQGALRQLDRRAAIAYASSRAGPSPPDVHVNHRWHWLFQSAFYDHIKPKADLLRCVFGNPFRPVAFDPAWRTDTAVSLARHIYESRDFSAMPILADALQDAGCENADVLDHCRGRREGVPGEPVGGSTAQPTHARGCWVVDLVLCKQ